MTLVINLSPNPRQILALLKKNYPDAHCELNHKNPYELLIATILSAQCTDERVNKVTPILFKKFPTPQALAEGSLKEIEEMLYSLFLALKLSDRVSLA